jgi:hypothetical protein
VTHLLRAINGTFRLAAAAADIATRTKTPAGACYNQAPEGVILHVFVQRGDDLTTHGIRIGVHMLGSIERDLANAGLNCLTQDRSKSFRHGCLPSRLMLTANMQTWEKPYRNNAGAVKASWWRKK